MIISGNPFIKFVIEHLFHFFSYSIIYCTPDYCEILFKISFKSQQLF